MRKNIIQLIMASIFSFIAPLLAYPIEEITAPSTMTKVELFQNGAQVYKEVSFNTKGEVVTIIVKDIPANIDPSTIRAKALGGQKIVSISFETDYKPTLEERRHAKALRDSLEQISLEIALKSSELASIQAQENLLERNMDVIDNQHGSAELEKILELNARERGSLKKRIVQISHAIKRLKIDRDDLQRRFESHNSKSRPLAGLVKIEVVTKANSKNSIELSYLVPDAWWSPVYDVRVSNIFEPMELEFRAEVFQHTEEDWNDVELHFYNNNPFLSGSLGDLQKWDLYFGSRPPVYAQDKPTELPPSMIQSGEGAISGVVTERGGLPIPFANVAVKRKGELITGASTDFDGKFEIKPLTGGYYDLEITSLGFSSQHINNVRVVGNKSTIYSAELQASAVQLEEFMVVEYKKPLIEHDAAATQETIMSSEIQRMAARSPAQMAASAGGTYSRDGNQLNIRGGRSSDYYIDGVKVRNSGVTGVAFAGNQDEMRVEFTAPGKQSVPSSEKVKLVYLKSETVPAHYVYRATPKIEPVVYLYAEIVDWERLNLLSGKVNLFYSNTFVGETYIDANNTDDTLSVSLGKDHDITVERERLKEEMNEPAIGAQTVNLGWKLKLKNTKDYPVSIRLSDQIPVSRHSAIDVDLKESDNAKLEKKSGKLIWEFDLAAGASAEKIFRYEVKLPKNGHLLLE